MLQSALVSAPFYLAMIISDAAVQNCPWLFSRETSLFPPPLFISCDQSSRMNLNSAANDIPRITVFSDAATGCSGTSRRHGRHGRHHNDT